jgi:hypothetical protein
MRARATQRLAEELSDAIASGAQIDWDELKRRTARLGSPPLLQNLRHLASRLSVDQGPGIEETTTPLWERVLAWSATLQVLAALLGAVVGQPVAHVFQVLPHLAIVAFAGTGLWLYLGGQRDPRARHLGIFFLLMATAPGQVPLRALLAALPMGGFAPWLSHVQLDALLPLLLWLFVRDFPLTLRVVRDAPLVSAGVAFSGFCGVVLLLANYALGPSGGVLEIAGLDLGLLARSHPAGGYWIAVFVLMLLALPVPILRARHAPAHEAARVRVFGWALVFALFPLLADILAGHLSPAWDQFSGNAETGIITTPIVYSFLLTLPFSTSWAVLRHGTIEVRELLRGALRVALARWTLGVVTAGLIVAGVALVYRHQATSLGELARTAEGATLGVLMGTGVALLAGRESVLVLLDGLLTGRRRSWRRGAARPLAQLRYARSFGELEERLAEGMAAALPGSALGLLVRHEQAGFFVPLAPGHPSLAPETAMLAMLRADPSPLRVQAEVDRSWFRWLPEAERQWIVGSRAALVAPLTDRTDEPIALAVVREPELPLVVEDEAVAFLAELVAAATASAESLLAGEDGSLARVLREEPCLECPSCLALFEEGDRSCGCSAPPIRSLLPRAVGGKFRLQRVLGSGAMGRAYLAEELALGRLVALKAMPRRSASGSVVLRREARAMAAVSHPNLASIHGLETWREVPVLVVEYLSGGTLAERLGSPTDETAALLLSRAVGAGLAALHAGGIAHRDIKPSNIAFSADGTPKLLDFGLSRFATSWQGEWMESGSPAEPVASTAAGTPLYLPPEVVRGEEAPLVDQDLWALAIVLYELLAGDHPLRLVAGDPLERLARGELPAPGQQIPNGGADVAEFLARCLCPEPARRPRSVVEFLADLQPLLTARGA